METIAPTESVAALQQNPATIARQARRLLWSETPPWGRPAVSRTPMAVPPHRRFIIRGLTRDGRTFRPSDWAERLAGAMSSFRPGGVAGGGPGAHIGYSPYCVPRLINGIK